VPTAAPAASNHSGTIDAAHRTFAIRGRGDPNRWRQVLKAALPD
jgi:hypothetical protein